MCWNITINKLFSQDKSFFVTTKCECTGWICENFPLICRRLHWRWVTEHICSLFLSYEDILRSWKLTMNRLFSQDKSFFVTDIKWVYRVNTQYQCRRCQMCGKVSQIHPIHSLFICYKKWLVLTEQSIHGNVSTHEDVLLC